jgi:iron complex outermembrane recepter protein
MTRPRHLPFLHRVIASFGALLLAAVGLAVETSVKFDVPAGDAEQTLRLFSTQSGVQVIFPTQAVRGVGTPAVRGDLPTARALELLLAGTPLVAVRDEQTGTITIRREAPDTAASKNVPGRPADAGAADPARGAERTADGKLRLQTFEVRSSRVDGLVNKGVIPTVEDSPIYHNIIDRFEIERMGATSIEEVLRNTSEITSYSTANQEASVVQIVGPNSLATNASMRGFDAQQTTVLINGRRIARAQFPNLVGAASGDLSRIPVAAIERIEIMPMSGSAMYGGGAIGGVINVILRKDYAGRELNVRIGTSTEGGAEEASVNYLHGFSFNQGRTTGTLTFDYRSRQPLSLADRPDFLRRALARLPIETAIGNFTQMPGVIRVSGATGDLGIPGATGVRYATVPAGLTPAQANALTPASFSGTAGQWTPSFERYRDNYIYTPSEAYSLTFTGEHQIIRDLLTLYGEFSATSNRQKIRNPKFFGAGTSYAMAATHPFNPFRTGVTPGFVGRAVILNVFMPDARPNITEMRRDTYRAVGGIKGRIGSDWEWSFDLTSEVTEIHGDSQVGADNINLATFFSTATNPASFPQRWGIYNLLADHDVYPVDPSVNELYFNSVAQQRYWQYASNAIARVSGDVYEWRAGTVKTSVGAESFWWQYEGKRPAASPQTLVDIMGGPANAPRSIAYSRQSRRTDAVLGELVVPVLSQRWRPVPLESLDLNFSARHESTNDSKSSYTTAAAFKVGLTRDLAVRGSYTEGFFPPEQNALHIEDYAFSTLITTNVTVIDPRRGNIAQTYAVTNSAGPNSALRPETSEAVNFGLIFTPRWLPGFRFNVDFWDIKKVDAIRTPTVAQLIANEGFFPDRVIRGPAIPGDPAGWAGPVTSFDTRFINIASQDTDGYDLNASYTFGNDAFGTFRLSSRATYTDKVKTQITPTSVATDTVRTRGGALRWRGTGSVFWERGVWRAGVSARYIDSYVTETTAPSTQFPTASGLDGPEIPSDLTWDVQFGYRVAYDNQVKGWRGWLTGTDWTVGALNVFNQMPPWFSTGFYSRYSDPRMRYVYLQVKKSL